jgi:cation:H+ antiporter
MELTLSPLANGAAFLAAALVIVFAGIALTRRVDILADRSGMGEALTGAVLLGMTTSLSGTVTSVVAAAEGNTALAISNALGGIGAQTAFLAVADLFLRRVNLEHAAASPISLTQASLLVVLLAMVLVAATMPAVSPLGIHPASFLLAIVYLAGLRLTDAVRRQPMWAPLRTEDTRFDLPEKEGEDAPGTGLLVAQLAGLIAAVAVAGWAVAETGAVMAAQTGLSQSIVGVLLTAVVTSLPELVTTVAAVRRGALQLAVGGIIGGNTYDVLFLAFSDIAYRDGSIYHAMETRHLLLIGQAMLMTGVLLLGLLRRERHGAIGIGFESVLLLLIYAGGVAAQIWMG